MRRILPGARPEAGNVEEEHGVDLVLPQPGRDVHPVTLHGQEVAELPPLGLQQIHAASLGVKHLVPDNNMVIMVVDKR